MKHLLMKQLFVLMTMVLPAMLVKAQYKPTDNGSQVSFTINNFGFSVPGTFKGLQGTIDFDPQHPEGSHFDVSIDASTVNTDNDLRDSHLKNDGYFDVKNYPRIKLVSTKVASTGKPGSYQFTGTLTIKDKTKVVSFPITAVPDGSGIVFKGSFTINRKDFGVGGTSTISNELTVSLSVTATK
jgi:polyisoprenoid-binding protein YceI